MDEVVLWGEVLAYETGNDPLTVTKQAKAVGSAGLEELPPGAKVSVRTAAQQMISASDNMATDLLIERLGPGAVERALAAGGGRWLGWVTPFGGAALALGWLALAGLALRRR